MIRIECMKCGRMVRDTFRFKWRHMVRFHPDHLVKRILPLLFLPAEELRGLGIQAADYFVKRLKNG